MPTPASDKGPVQPASRVQLLLRWVWLIIGVLLLVLILWAVVFVARESMGGAGGGASAADSARRDSARGKAAEPLRYDPPDTIRGSATRIVPIRRGSGYTYQSRASSRAATGAGPTVNVVFLEGSGARLLLDGPAYIKDVIYPGRRPEGDGLRWIVYEMALGDTDRSGGIDETDARSLYVTDLNGRGLRRVLPPGYQLLDWAPQPGGSLVITAVQITRDGKAMPERAFVLDPAGTVRPYAVLDSVVDAAGTIVRKP
jgi:hypothetical protein